MQIKTSTFEQNFLLSMVNCFKALIQFSGKGLRKNTETSQT